MVGQAEGLHGVGFYGLTRARASERVAEGTAAARGRFDTGNGTLQRLSNRKSIDSEGCGRYIFHWLMHL